MAIIIDQNTPTIVQGITGSNAALHTGFMLKYGTKIVGGITPGKAGQSVEGIPVYDTVKDCVSAHSEATLSSIWVPPRFAKDAILEAIEGGIKNIVVITERIPVHDMLYARHVAKERGVMIIGGNTPGVISPGKALVGMLPKIAFTAGRIGTVARSGAVTYYIANSLNLAGLGESTSVGLGGDPILGANFEDVLRLFDADAETDALAQDVREDPGDKTHIRETSESCIDSDGRSLPHRRSGLHDRYGKTSVVPRSEDARV